MPVERRDPAPIAEGPYQRLLREVAENYPDAVTVPMRPDQKAAFTETAHNNDYILDMSYRQGILTVRYVGRQQRRT